MATNTASVVNPITQHKIWAEDAVKYVNSRLTKGAGNKLWDIIKSAFKSGGRDSSLDVTLNMRAITIPIVKSATTWSSEEKIRFIAACAEHARTGNCFEYTMVAAVYLLDKYSVIPEVMQFKEPGKHNFLVIGRSSTTKVEDFVNWGPEAIICDPWLGKAYPPLDLAAYWPGQIPELGTLPSK